VPAEEWQAIPFVPAVSLGSRFISCIPLFAEESLVGALLLRSLYPLSTNDQSVFFDLATQLAAVLYALRVRLRSSQLKNAFARAVDSRVMEHLLAKPEEMGGASVLASALFLDIRDFTTFSENHEPEYVVARLNDFFMKMEACVRAEGGLINKFTGDGFLALFGVPNTRSDHAVCAVRAAVAMVAAARAEKGDANDKAFRVGIGIASGPMVCGTIGSPSRLEFTVIGDTVNAAARIESLNRTFGSELLVTRATIEAAAAVLPGGLDARFLGPVKVKGKLTSLDLFEVLGAAGTVLEPLKMETMPAFAAALEARLTGDTEKARRGFESLIALSPKDGAVQHNLNERRQEL
jgi:adenylate cyclase